MQFKNIKTKPKEGETCHRCGATAEFMIKIHYPDFDGLGSGLKYSLCDECWNAWGNLLMRHDEEKMVFLGLAKEPTCPISEDRKGEPNGC